MLPQAPVRITEQLQRIPVLAQYKQLYIEPMEGSASNRSYLVRTQYGQAFTVRFDTPSRDIFARSRTDELKILKLLKPFGVAPEPIAYDERTGASVFRYVPGHPVSESDAASPKFHHEMRHFFQRCYTLPGQTTPLNLKKLLETYWKALSPEKQPLYARLYRLDRQINPIALALNSLRHEFRTCHMDLTPGNLLWSNGKIIAIDWEYVSFFHPMIDLAIFANNWSLSNDTLKEIVPSNCIVRWSVFDEVRVLAAYLEAIWYAVRATLDRDNKRWQRLAEKHLSQVETGAN